MRMLGEPCGSPRPGIESSGRFLGLGFCKVFIHKVLYDIGDHLARDGRSASACARGIRRGRTIQIFNPLVRILQSWRFSGEAHFSMEGDLWGSNRNENAACGARIRSFGLIGVRLCYFNRRREFRSCDFNFARQGRIRNQVRRIFAFGCRRVSRVGGDCTPRFDGLACARSFRRRSRGSYGTRACFPVPFDSTRGQKVVPMTTPTLTEVASLACLFFIFLTPLAAAGLALINAGLGRSHSAAHIMMSSLCALAVAALVYFAFGFGWEGFIGGPAHIITVAGKGWNWIAAEPFFFRKLASADSPAFLSALLQVFCVALAALIPLGSGADRWRFRASCLSTAFRPAGRIRFSRTGSGVAAGSRNWA